MKKKTKTIKLRITDEEAGMIEFLRDKTGETKSEILRKGLKMYYNLELYKD